MDLLLSPHNDDETLFAAYTILRAKPLVVVVTDSYVQFNRGDNISAEERRKETEEACKILGADVRFLALRDDELTEDNVKAALSVFDTECVVYAPAVQGGHLHHDIIGKVAKETFPHTIFYATYTKTNLTPEGNYEIKPTQEEIDLKNKALDCYTSQLRINKAHFDAVQGKSEYYEA